MFENSNRFQPLVTEEDFHDAISSINNNDNKDNNDNNDKAVNDEDSLDEAFQQGETSSTKVSASFKKKEITVRAKNMAILGDSMVKCAKL